LQDGTYRVTAQLKGWAPQEQTLTVNDKRNQGSIPPFVFPHGTVEVGAGNPPGLQIHFNNQLAGIAPTNIPLPPGTYEFTFRAEDHADSAATIKLADKQRHAVNPVLKALAGRVDISADPPGTEIYDQTGRRLCVASNEGPTRVALEPGRYDFKATYADLPPVERKGWRSNPARCSRWSRSSSTTAWWFSRRSSRPRSPPPRPFCGRTAAGEGWRNPLAAHGRQRHLPD